MSLNNRRRISSSNLILIGIAIPVITLFVVFIQTYESILSNQEQTKSVIESHETINSLKDVLISMINAETGQRGYIITGNLSYLEPYKSPVANLDNQLVTLNTLISGNSGQESKLGQLISLIDERLSILNSTIQTRYNDGYIATAEAIVAGSGKLVMDQIRNTVSSMTLEEENYLQKITRESQTKQQNLLLTTIAGLLISIIVSGITLFVTYSSLHQRHVQIQNLLESEVQKRTEELALANEQLEKNNEELKRNDELQKEFINTAAHELRTPSQAIIGFAELLNKSPKRNRGYEETLLRNANRLHRLSTDILDVARIEAGTMKINKSQFDLNEKITNVINDVKQASSSDIKNKDIEIIFHPGNPIMVNADKAKIFQVISNLLDNSIKFTNHGAIIITAKQNDNSNESVVTITDTGKGIDADVLPYLFQKFRPKSKTGTGIGLYITKKIIEAHRGTIKGYNNSAGKGATFSFTLPL